jgi:hypothetical protein
MTHQSENQKVMQVQDELERELGRRVPKQIWEFLVEKGYVQEYLDGHSSLSGLARSAEELLNLRDIRMKPTRRPRRVDQRDFVSEQIAQHARDDSRVVEFRSNWLQAGVVTRTDAHELLLHLAGNDREARKWVRVLLDPGLFREHLVARRLPTLPVLTGPVDRLGASIDRTLAASPLLAGAIGELLELVLGLARDYPWSFGQATQFVLTDEVPDVPPVRTNWNPGAFPQASRLTLVVDPLITNQELIARLRQARESYVNERVPGVCLRGQTLVDFILTRPTSERWDSIVAAWNRLHPEWEYAAGNMRRDAGKWHPKIYGSQLPRRTGKGARST